MGADANGEEALDETKEVEEGVAQVEGGVDAGEGADDGAAADNGEDGYKAAIAERDEKIRELEAKVAQAARTSEATKALNREISELKKSAAAEREEFELRLAGVRNVKAARALLGDHKGDVAALKEAEPWLFGEGASGGATALPNAGAAYGGEAELKRWRRIAGLEE